jgi:hypothetical protein
VNLDPLAAEPKGSAFTRYELAAQSTGRELRQGGQLVANSVKAGNWSRTPSRRATGRELRQGGTVVMRADSAYYPAAFCGPVRRVGTRFSVMVQIDPKIAAAIG